MADISKIKLPNNTTYDINATTVNGHTVDKNVPSNAVFTDTNTHRPIKVNGSQILGNNTTPFNLVSGDNVRMAITGSGSVTIHSDQIDDSYTYSQYQDLPSATKMQDKIFMVKDAPNPPSIPVVDEYAREQIEDVKSNLTEYAEITDSFITNINTNVCGVSSVVQKIKGIPLCRVKLTLKPKTNGTVVIGRISSNYKYYRDNTLYRYTIPLVQDSDGSSTGSLYLNDDVGNSYIYKVTANVTYYADFFMILNENINV